MTRQALNIATFPIHLGLSGRADPQPEFTGSAWYEDYSRRVSGDGAEGRLVSFHEFAGDWDSWECHPAGEEVVLCLSGRMTLIQELGEGRFHSEAIGPGEYIVNPAGVWHTADITGPASALFITCGEGTQNKPR